MRVQKWFIIFSSNIAATNVIHYYLGAQREIKEGSRILCYYLQTLTNTFFKVFKWPYEETK